MGIMKTYHLPDDLTAGAAVPEHEVIIRSYTPFQPAENNRIILQRNMINLIIKGAKTFVYPRQTTVVNEGGLVWLSTGNMLTSEVLGNGKAFQSVLLYFSNGLLNNFIFKYQHLLPETAVPQPVPFLLYQQDSFVQHYTQSLLLLLNHPAALTPEIKQTKLEELLLYLVQQDAAKFQSLRSQAQDYTDLHIQKTMEAQVGRNISVAELAFLCNMSVATFKRKFERLYHTSPQQWLLQRRLALATELLQSPSETPANVYLKVGYQNHSSFSQAFRQKYGLTPSEYHAQQMSVLR